MSLDALSLSLEWSVNINDGGATSYKCGAVYSGSSYSGTHNVLHTMPFIFISTKITV